MSSGKGTRRSRRASNAARLQQARRASNARRRSSIDPDEMVGGMDLDDQEMDLAPIEVKRVPPHQIEGLSEEQKDEVFTKVITAADPNVSKNLTRFHYKDMEFKIETKIDHLAVHFQMEGILLHVDSEEARELTEMKEAEEQKRQQAALVVPKKGGDTEEGGGEDGEEKQEEFLKNQFNFSERATQTFNNPLRDKDVCTEPPPTKEFSNQVTCWEIFDTYLAELERKMLAATLQEQKKANARKKQEDDSDMLLGEIADVQMDGGEALFLPTSRMARAIKMMERMVHTNSESECFHDYKYYEDKSEHKREDGRGSFLPLWRFAFERANRKTVSAICWNPQHTDLYAVGYGSYDFANASQSGGLVCCFTLKNTSYPEFTFETDSGVMSVDFHPVHNSLLCVGLYDGTVCVYDVKTKTGVPIYISSDPKVKHTDPVWQVYWSRDLDEDPEKPASFFSVSSDGRVTKWVLSKNDLINEEIVELRLGVDKRREDAGTASSLVGLAGGCCFDFNRQNPHIFAVGTEEGAIHTYSKAYNSTLLRSFQGHHMAVYSVKWNVFHPNVFLSCSADWTVKLWERNTSKPVMTFDLNTSVGDVAWAPFSSTVFACITTDGRVRVYDLNVNKHEPIGETRVNKKAKLTHVSFNPVDPIICVGDDRGVVTVLKLSSNLRKMSAPKLEDMEPEEEIAKLDKVMIMPDDVVEGESPEQLT